MNSNSTKSNGDAPWLEADVIKQQVKIEDVLSYYGLLEQMKRNGNRLKSKSPFRDEQKASFFVNTEKGVWNDFGGRPDNVPGNVIGLVQAIENCSFREALVILSRNFIEETINSQDKQEYKGLKKAEKDQPASTPKKKKALPKVNEPWGRVLKGRTKIPFILEKGITEETIKEFGAVYCTSGLHKGRIAIPVRNKIGEILCYAGRAVKKTDEEENGKYRFPPKFNKSVELFNIDRLYNDSKARKAVRDFGIVIVEGFFDAMKLHQETFKNVVAIMGTDFHEAQKKELLNSELNPTRRVTIFLDNDEAGRNGKRKIAKDCINDGFVRYVDWSNVAEEKTEPEHFMRDEFVELLSLK